MALPVEVDGGGTPGAVKFRIIAQEPTIMELSADRVVDAVRLTIRDGIYGVVFGHTITKADYDRLPPEVVAEDWASYVQEIAGHDHVIGIDSAQEQIANGRLRDVLYVTVSTDDELHQGVATVPFATLNTPTAFNIIDAAYRRLVLYAEAT